LKNPTPKENEMLNSDSGSEDEMIQEMCDSNQVLTFDFKSLSRERINNKYDYKLQRAI